MPNDNRFGSSPKRPIDLDEARGYRDLSAKDRALLASQEEERKAVRLREKRLDNFEGINEREAKKMGLARVALPAYSEAQRFFNRIMHSNREDGIDLSGITNDGLYKISDKELMSLWEKNCPNLPVMRDLRTFFVI